MILSLIATLVVLGIVFYCVELIPMAAPFPQIIRVVAILVAIVLVLQAFGVPLLGAGRIY